MRLHHVLCVSTLAACATSDGVDDPDDLRDTPRRATIAAAETTTVVRAAARVEGGVDSGDARLDVREGALVAHVDLGPDDDDRLVIDELRLAYRDVVLPAAHFHQGQVLTNIEARLQEPLSMRAVWTSDGAVWGSAAAAVRLDWDMRIDGEAHEMLAQTLSGLTFELVVSEDKGGVRFDLEIVRPGVMWSWADIVTLGDTHVQAVAYPTPPID